MWQSITPANALRRLPSGGSRTISTTVLSTKVALPPLEDRHAERWSLALGSVVMGPGDVANFGTADAAFCPQRHIAALHGCMQAWGIPTGDEAPVALGCQGSGFHHDADSYAGHGFCVLWLSEDEGWDLLFPLTGQRIELAYGTVALFDSAFLHGVVARGATRYCADDFTAAASGLFLSQDFPLQETARRLMAVAKFSRNGVAGRIILGADGIQEDVDIETGHWSARDVNRKA